MLYSRTRTITGLVPLLAVLATLCGCLSSNPKPSGGASQGPVVAPVATTPAAGAAQTSTPTAVVSQPQPGSNGKVIAGVVAFDGSAPPAGSSLYLGLVKSADDQQPRTCIDAGRDPINEVGQFYAQVACTPQPGDQLLYVLVIGPEGLRNWHRGVVTMPPDLANVHLDVQQ